MFIQHKCDFGEQNSQKLSLGGRLQLGRHERNSGLVAGLIADALGLAPERCRLIERATALHDIGKVFLPAHIFEKAGPLDAAEEALMRMHPLTGHAFLKSRRGSPILELGAYIALVHHERWDGSGYPFGRVGAEIELPGRIAAIGDIYAALRESRPYKGGLSHDQAIEIITEEFAGKIDALVINAMMKCENNIREIIDDREIAHQL
ncbi:HD-GYP domain-containing protein [Novosphingobium sp.]|uniref:HD-GYP domain-containing protein n=1 Tax=Novosphingobium sp. TaxID=1874826 RepID=UPI0035B39D3D